MKSLVQWSTKKRFPEFKQLIEKNYFMDAFWQMRYFPFSMESDFGQVFQNKFEQIHSIEGELFLQKSNELQSSGTMNYYYALMMTPICYEENQQALIAEAKKDIKEDHLSNRFFDNGSNIRRSVYNQLNEVYNFTFNPDVEKLIEAYEPLQFAADSTKYTFNEENVHSAVRSLIAAIKSEDFQEAYIISTRLLSSDEVKTSSKVIARFVLSEQDVSDPRLNFLLNAVGRTKKLNNTFENFINSSEYTMSQKINTVNLHSHKIANKLADGLGIEQKSANEKTNVKFYEDTLIGFNAGAYIQTAHHFTNEIAYAMETGNTQIALGIFAMNLPFICQPYFAHLFDYAKHFKAHSLVLPLSILTGGVDDIPYCISQLKEEYTNKEIISLDT